MTSRSSQACRPRWCWRHSPPLRRQQQTSTLRCRRSETSYGNTVPPNRSGRVLERGNRLRDFRSSHRRLLPPQLKCQILSVRTQTQSPQRAVSGTRRNRLSVTVTPGAPASVTVSPASQTFTPGQVLPYSAVASDAFGNVIPGATFNWTAESGSITSPGVSASHTASTVASTYTIEASVVGAPTIKDTSQAVVLPGPAVRAEITPPNATLDRGQNATFTLIGYDAFNNVTTVKNTTWNTGWRRRRRQTLR